MGKAPIGNKLILSGNIQALTDLQINCVSITLRSAQSNNIVYLYDSTGAVQIGYLLQAEAVTLEVSSPHRIYVLGTEGNALYWFAEVAK